MGFVILTAKPIAGHGTEASGRSSGQDDPAAADDGHAGNAAAEPTATAQQ